MTMKGPVTFFVTRTTLLCPTMIGIFLLTLSPTTLAATYSTTMANAPTIVFLATTIPTTTLGIKINEIHRPIILESSKPNLSQPPKPRYPDGHMPHIYSLIVTSIIVIIAIIILALITILITVVTVLIF